MSYFYKKIRKFLLTSWQKFKDQISKVKFSTLDVFYFIFSFYLTKHEDNISFFLVFPENQTYLEAIFNKRIE